MRLKYTEQIFLLQEQTGKGMKNYDLFRFFLNNYSIKP